MSSRASSRPKVEVVNSQKYVRISDNKIAAIAEYVIGKEKPKARNLSILVCDDRRIRDLHKKYLKKDSATDVISFGMPARHAKSEDAHLGDVVVSAQTAKRVCKSFGQTAKDEVLRYVVHGILHLVGYDDHSKKDYELMFRTQEKHLRDFLKSKS